MGSVVRAAVALIAGLVANGAAGHEFWIAAGSHRAAPGTEIAAHLRVGQEMSGEDFPYLSRSVAEMRHWTPTGSDVIAAREGDLPAIANLRLDAPGLHRLSVVTHPAYVVFDTLPEFADYLAYEGLDRVVEAHRERGLAPEGVAEAYIRYARALVQVGPPGSDQSDLPTALAFELTALGNPFLAGDVGLQVRLHWQGEASAGTQISVFHLPQGGVAPADTVRTVVRTDADGFARVPVGRPGAYLLNAVLMEPVEGPGSVVWQSHWASLTFVIGEPE